MALGLVAFAMASAGVAVWNLAYGRFAAQFLPAWFPWPHAWTCGSAVFVLIASAALIFPRSARVGTMVIGAYDAITCAIALPNVMFTPLSIGAWYPVCEALTALVGAWLLYALLRRRLAGAMTTRGADVAMRTAQTLFGLTCIFYGWSHFVYAAYTASMVPSWLPAHRVLTYLTGLAHVTAGLAITAGIFPRLAATLEATMMSLFGLLVWVPSFFARPRPSWATPTQHQWHELVVTAVLATSAWIVAISLGDRPWGFGART